MKSVVFFLVGMALVRCGWVAAHDISPQEAYYWMCSERLAPAFFDGPPGTAFLVSLLDGGTWGISLARFAWPLLGLMAGALAWLLARNWYDRAVAGWVVVALNVLPVFNRDSVTIGPAMPALVCALAGTGAALAAWEGRRAFWVPAGVFFSMGVLFRYEVVLVPAGLVLAGLATAKHRTRGNLAGLGFVVLLLGLALWNPLAWNASLEWIPMAPGTWQTAWTWRAQEFFPKMGLFFRAFSIAAGIALLAGVGWMACDARAHVKARSLLAVCGLAWVWWLYGVLRGEGDGFVALMGSVPVLAFLFAQVRRSSRAPLAAMLVIGIALATTGAELWADARERARWKPLAEEIQSAVRDMPAGEGGGFFIAENPDLAAVLGYYVRSGRSHISPDVFVPESPDISSQFGLWPSYADFVESGRAADEFFTEQHGANPYVGRTALYVGHDLPQTIRSAFERVRTLRIIRRAGSPDLTIFLCLNYQTMPL